MEIYDPARKGAAYYRRRHEEWMAVLRFAVVVFIGTPLFAVLLWVILEFMA